MKKSINKAELASKQCPFCKSEDINLGRIGNPLFRGCGYTISSCNRCDSSWQLVYDNSRYTNLYITEDKWNVNVCKFCGTENGEYNEWRAETHSDFCEESGENAVWVRKEEFANNHNYKIVCAFCGEEHGSRCEEFDIVTEEWVKRWFPKENDNQI